MTYRKLPLSESDCDSIWEGFNEAYGSLFPADNVSEEVRVALKILDDAGDVIAGCVFDIDALNNAELERLWVDERYRRQGYASALILEAERQARDKGCRTMTNAYCFDFQPARPLFEKLGYRLFGVAEDWPKGHAGYTFMKCLDIESDGCEKHEPICNCVPAVIIGDETDASFIAGKLEEYNCAFAPRSHPYYDLDLKLVDENGDMIAGIVAGVSGWDTLHVDMMWVKEELRCQGIGSYLLSETEREAKAKGAYLARLDAISYAADFFLTQGYEVILAYEDEPKWFVMQKRL